MTCEKKAADELLALGFMPIDIQDPDLLGYLKFLCAQGASPKWIANHIFRLKTLKDLLDGVQSIFPLLTAEDLETLADMHMDGVSAKKIRSKAEEIAKQKSSSSPKPP